MIVIFAFVLFSFNFTISSCKSCSEDKGKGGGKDENNTIAGRTVTDDAGADADANINTDKSGLNKAPVLDAVALSEGGADNQEGKREAEEAGNDKEKATEQERHEFNAALEDVKQAHEVVEAIWNGMCEDILADYADVPAGQWERVDALKPITDAAFYDASIAYEEIEQVMEGFRIE